MTEYKEKKEVVYTCGCISEIGLIKGTGVWEETGDNKKPCNKHKDVV